MPVKTIRYLTALVWLCWLSPAHALTPKVLIVGIDGTRVDALAVARTPNLEALKSNGCYTVRALTHPVTHSAACWSSMFTGVWGDKHGVNDPNNSFTGNRFATYPSFFKHLELANGNLNTLCFARWAPLTNVVPDADVRLTFDTDAAITAETCRRLTNSNPDVFYTILLDVDSAGHSYGWGPTVPQYVQAIESADARVGQIMAALYARPSYTNEDWLVIILTDHGEHDNPNPEKSRITWHIVAGPSAARGVIWPSPAIVDVCATVLTHMGVPIDPAWNLDARVEGLPLPPPTYGSNLIFNGDAEANSGTNAYGINRGIAWWFDLSSTTLGSYGSNPAFPSSSSPGPAQRGLNLFLGGTNNSFISQRIDISSVSADIDNPGVEYLLSGWFGGAGFDADSATLTANFLGASGVVLGSDSIGGVSATDRAGVTGLLLRTNSGALPVGTRMVEFALTNQVANGMNDASADNLSFILTPRPDTPFPIIAHGWTNTGSGPISYYVGFNGLSQRLYTLERSFDLLSWTDISLSAPGSDPLTILTDINPPFARAFYRVRAQRAGLQP